jgi:hypothetical protein
MCTDGNYEKWKDGSLLLFDGPKYGYPEEKHPEPGYFYTEDEAIEFEKSSIFINERKFNWDDKMEVKKLLHNNDWYSYNDWISYAEEYETFEESFITPGGENIVAFGYYGHD